MIGLPGGVKIASIVLNETMKPEQINLEQAATGNLFGKNISCSPLVPIADIRKHPMYIPWVLWKPTRFDTDFMCNLYISPVDTLVAKGCDSQNVSCFF